MSTNNYIINGRYRIEKELGKGGMGIVYLAYDLNLSRYVAIKILKSSVSSESAFIRFKNEVFSIVRLDHPNIIHVYDAGFDSNIYYVMQYIDGTDLAKELTKKHRFELNDTLHIIYQISAALDYAHGKGFFHRDVKPENILLDTSNNAYLVDFGITTSASLPHVTEGFIGTVEYASPEHCSGGVITGKSDQYSLAVVIYEMLTGRTPFISEGGNSVAVAIKHINEIPPDPREFCPTIPENAAKAILKALSKQPEKRFPSCNAFVSCISGMSLDYFSTGKLSGTALIAAATNISSSVSTSKSVLLRKAGLIPKKLELGAEKNFSNENTEPRKSFAQLKPKMGYSGTPSSMLNSQKGDDRRQAIAEKPMLQSFGNTSSRRKDFEQSPESQNRQQEQLMDNDDFLRSLYSSSEPEFKQDNKNVNSPFNSPNIEQPINKDDDFLNSLSRTSSSNSKFGDNTINPFRNDRQPNKEDDDFLNSLSPISSDNAKTRNPFRDDGIKSSKDDDDFLNSLSPISSDNAKTANPFRDNERQPNKEDDAFLNSLSPISSDGAKNRMSYSRDIPQQSKVEEQHSKEDDDFLSSLSPISSNGSKNRTPYSRDIPQKSKVEEPYSKEDDDFLSSLSPISSDSAKTRIAYSNENKEEKSSDVSNSNMANREGSSIPRSPYSREKKEEGSSTPRSPYSRERKEEGSSIPRSPYSRERKEEGSSTPRSPYGRERKEEDSSTPRTPYSGENKEGKQNIEDNNGVSQETHLIKPEEPVVNLNKEPDKTNATADSSTDNKREQFSNKFKKDIPSDFKPGVGKTDSEEKAEKVETEQTEQEGSGKLSFKDLEKSRVLEEERQKVLQAANLANTNVSTQSQQIDTSVPPAVTQLMQNNNVVSNIPVNANIPQMNMPSNTANTVGNVENKSNNSTLLLILFIALFLVVGAAGYFVFVKKNYVELADKSYQAQNYSDAISNYEQARKSGNLTPEIDEKVVWNLIDSYSKSNSIDKAIEYLNILKEKYPSLYSAKSGLIAPIYKSKAEQAEDYDNKTEFYSKVLEINPEDIESAESLAEIYNVNEEFDKAEKLYLDLLPKVENKGKIYSSLATMFSNKNDFSKALDYFQKAEKEGGEIAYPEYVKVLKKLGKNKEALALINKVLEANPTLATEGAVIALDLADSLKDKQDTASKSKFTEYINTAKKLSKESVDEKFNEIIENGADLVTKKNYSKAISIFEYALKIKPDSGKAWYKYLSALYKSGNKNAVIENSGKALKFNAKDSAVTNEIKKWVAQINKERAAAQTVSRPKTPSYNSSSSQQYNSNRGYNNSSSSNSSYSRPTTTREYDNPNPTPAPQRRRVSPQRSTISIPKIPSNYFKPVKKGQQRDVQSIPSSE